MSTILENSLLLFHQISILPHSLLRLGPQLHVSWGCVHHVSYAVFLFGLYILFTVCFHLNFSIARISSTNPTSCWVHSAVTLTQWVLHFRFELLLQYSFQTALLRFNLQTAEFTHFRQTKIFLDLLSWAAINTIFPLFLL